MSRTSFVILAIAAALVVGVVGDVTLFHTSALGLGMPFFVLVLVAAVLITGRLARVKINRRNLWVLIPLVFFALMIALRADWNINAVNAGAVLAIGAIGLFYLYSPHVIDEDALIQHSGAALEGSAGTTFMPLQIGVEAAGIGWKTLKNGKLPPKVIAVGRGALIAVPILLVFGVLFIAADAVFAGMANRLTQLFDSQIWDELAARAFGISLFAWVACGAIAYGVGRFVRDEQKPAAEPSDADSKPKRYPFTLGMIESTVVLASVAGLFAVFVVVQFAYFFGGASTLELAGLTYAEYARRGFFELLAVSILTLGLVLTLDWVTVRHNANQKRIFRIASTALVALTGVILFSAAQRMYLYEEAYGFTHLRVFVHVFIYWLAVLFVVFLLALFRVRGDKRIFSVGVLLVVVGYVVTLNLMNLDQYIAVRNIERYQQGQKLDVVYLYNLSVDATPALIDFYFNTSKPAMTTDDDWEYAHYAIGQWLARQYYTLSGEQQREGGNPFAFNLSRWGAYGLLQAWSLDLPEYNWDFYLSSDRYEDF